MRILHSLPAVLFSILLTTGVKAQDETGLPGDNFSLEGALEMFKKAGNPEEFEKMLNTKKNGINNLDLNNDGNIDYIRVVNKKDGDVQLFVLQSLVSASESQDIAVIELEKTGDQSAVVQIVGDEDIYGVSKIVEPSREEETAYFEGETYSLSDRPAHGPNATVEASGLVVNVWFWPFVRYVYAPHYTVWVSPWRWYHYPVWWDPWEPLAWHVYQPICYRYRPHYVVVHTHRVMRAPRIYRPMRVSSPYVYNRNRVVVNNYRTNYNRSMPRRTDNGVVNRNDRSVRPRQFDRATSENKTTPRTFDRNSNVNRPTAPGRADRTPDVNRSTPSRRYDRTPDANRPTAPGRADRTPDVNRSTPSRRFDRNTARPQINAPNRNYDRSSAPSAAPQRQYNRREINRSPSPAQRSADRPQRQFNRSSAPGSRPQGGQINRGSSGSRSSGAPQRTVQRSPRGRS
ncbi:hypothetical protein ACFOTA_01275 [Chitinophaga sp. GCM10012297]|uniref:DUF3300 domain-containing protein n=1 Tax=Chitinophaga chungangae TaxID=2821488 RepID=A0ABS3Y829_9BACT|nr:hypothetical protein [Chitinophaga chungangae]MBO9150823.1 hypothetical protein [Chitinophaga chungangae]